MAAFTSTQNGNWRDGATWGNASPGVEGTDYPGASDNATMTHTVALTAAQAAVNVTIGASGILNTANYAITISGVWDQSSTSSRCNAGTSTITVNGNGAFTADGTLDSTQYNSATLVLNGTNTLTYGNLAASYANGFNNLTCGQGGNTTTLDDTLAVRSVMTIGSGELTGASNSIYVLGATPLSVDAGSHLSINVLVFQGTSQTIPTLANGYDCSIQIAGSATTVTQTGDATLNSSKFLYIASGTSQVITWNTDGYNLTVGGYLRIGAGSDTGLKTFNATGSGGRTSTITVGGNWLNYGTGSAPSVFTAADSTVILNAASGTKTVTSGFSNSKFNTIQFNGAGTFSIVDELRANLVTYTAGTITNSGYIRPWPYPANVTRELTMPQIRQAA